jgi:hypothetical protein
MFNKKKGNDLKNGLKGKYYKLDENAMIMNDISRQPVQLYQNVPSIENKSTNQLQRVPSVSYAEPSQGNTRANANLDSIKNETPMLYHLIQSNPNLIQKFSRDLERKNTILITQNDEYNDDGEFNEQLPNGWSIDWTLNGRKYYIGMKSNMLISLVYAINCF